MSVPINRSLERVPGGMMIVPLLIGALLHTIFPNAGPFFGSFTGALFDGALTILAVFYVCMGASIDVRATPYILKKGGALFATKVALAVVIGVGSRARVVAPGPYFGRVGTVVKRGRSRYHLRIAEGLLTVVFAGAEPA